MSELNKLSPQTYGKCADTDSSPEYVASKEGQYIDANNMRRSSTTGQAKSLEKINGELVIYPTYEKYADSDPSHETVSLTGYECLCFTEIKGHLFAVYAHSDSATYLPCITIDDKLVARSENLGFTIEHPIQLDINESCVGGEVFLTDDNITPYIFNIQDMLDRWDDGSDVYFASFNPNIYTVTLERQNDQPVFVGLDDVGAGQGLDFGMYMYALRYRDLAGNVTSIGAFTPMIPVIYRYNKTQHSGILNETFPNHMTRGASNLTYTNVNSRIYGIDLRFRVTNIADYNSVEIIRVAWNEESPYGTTPNAKYCVVPITITSEETSVQTFKDYGNDTNVHVVWSDLTESEETQVLAAIQTAKAIRYYDNRIVLMNVKYASKDLSDVGIEVPNLIDGENLFPYVHNMGVQGHADPRNTTYYKGYRGGEGYGYAVLCQDYNGEDAFALPIDVNGTGEIVYKFPNNREKLSTNSTNISAVHGKGVVNAPNINTFDNDIISNTGEIINLEPRGAVNNKTAYNPKCKQPLGSSVLISIHKDDTFNPIHPVSQDDSDTQGHLYTVQTFNYRDVNLTDNVNPYNYVFAPELYAKGIGISAVRGLPSWVKSFQIVRTEPIKRVVTQGIGVYAFKSEASHEKYKNRLWFYSQELEEFNLSISIGQQLQLVSPLGFNTEVYNAFKQDPLSPEHRGIDMVSYARLIRNSSGIGTSPTNVGLNKRLSTGSDSGSYYTEHGSWRNADALASNPFYDGTGIDGNKIFTITNVQAVAKGRFTFYEITVDTAIENFYNYESALGDSAIDTSVKQYHEPFYLVNIINDNADIPQNNMTTYYKTGHHQKLESIIGTGIGTSQTIQLCDERYDDCIPSEYSTFRDLIDSFVFIRNKTTGEEQRWLNITHKSSTIKDAVIAALNGVNHKYTISTPYPNPFGLSNVDIYGVYTSDWNTTSDESGKDATIIFDSVFDSSGTALGAAYCIPDTENYIIVKYDTRFPLKVFGGDTIISEDTTCFIDAEYNSNGDNVSGEQILFKPFPYGGIKFDNARYKRIKNAATPIIGGAIQIEDTYGLQYIRQWAVNFFHESRIHFPYSYGDIISSNGVGWVYSYRRKFPQTHYVMRPEKWNDNNIEQDNFHDNVGGGGTGAINSLYDNEAFYPKEWGYWRYGGFRANALSSISEKGDTYNIDYQKTDNYQPTSSKPVVGFVEETDFCSRVIWSDQRNISQQNVPQLNTFPSTNVFDLEDANGEIKKAFNAETSKGDNLYAFTENGVALLLTSKEMTQDANGDLIAYVRTGDKLVSGRIWLREDCGMDMETWRSAAEWNKSIIWGNSESCYMMFDNKINDIGRIGYYNRLYNDGLSLIRPNYESNISAVYDRKHNEYWLTLGFKAKDVNLSDLEPSTCNYYWLNKVLTGSMSYAVDDNDWLNITEVNVLMNMVILPTDFSEGEKITITNSVNQTIRVFDYNVATPVETMALGATSTYIYSSGAWSINTDAKLSETFVFSIEADNMGWVGTFDYNFEKYTFLNGIVYGIRDGETYELGTGYTINGSNIEANVTSVCNNDVLFDKEFISILISAKNKPTRVDFSNILADLPECSLYAGMSTPPNAYYLKEYGSNRYTNKIPRKLAGDRVRVQGQVLIFDIQHNTAEPFVLLNSIVNYRSLKLQM